MKKPWLTALLNVVPLGFGYIYLERDGRFYVAFPVGICATLGLLVDPIVAGVWALLILAAVATVQDAWRLAQRHNEELNQQGGENSGGARA